MSEISRALHIIVRTFALALGEFGTPEESEPKRHII